MEIRKLIEVANFVDGVKSSPMWNEILYQINENDVDYQGWSDLEVIIWYHKYQLKYS